MAFEHGRGGKRGRDVTGRKRTAVAIRPIAADGVLHPLHEGFRENLRSHEVEPEM